MYDMIIIGAGTAGLTAAVYAGRSGKKVLVLEAKNAGGQIINSPMVENYPGIKSISGFEFIKGLQEQAADCGAVIKGVAAESITDGDRIKEVAAESITDGDRIKEVAAESITDRARIKEVVTADGEKMECRAVIIAAGMVYRRLGLENEEAMTGSGVSYCAVCDGAFYRGKDVAVIGGGNTALEDAVFLSEHCRKVYVIHRRDRFRGEARLVDVLHRKENVEFVLESEVTSLRGEERLESIIVKNTVTRVISELKVSGLFVAIGQTPRNEIFRDVVELSEQGYIRADETCHTSTPGIFAAGDCRTKKVRQLVTAAADGAVAALEACKYLNQ